MFVYAHNLCFPKCMHELSWTERKTAGLHELTLSISAFHLEQIYHLFSRGTSHETQKKNLKKNHERSQKQTFNRMNSEFSLSIKFTFSQTKKSYITKNLSCFILPYFSCRLTYTLMRDVKVFFCKFIRPC